MEEESKCSKCCKCFQEKVIPELDFLHSPPSYETKKITSFSRFGLLLTFFMFATFIILFFILYIQAENDYTVSYSQDFIPRRNFSEKKITLGFNTSNEWKNKLIFELYDSKDEAIKYTNCDENLMETKNNGTYYCIVNYSIVKAPLTSYALKLNITLKNKTEEEYEVPFSFVIREPYIDHDNIENPLNIYHKTSINKFSCIYNTKEISSYRRYLKLINYYTDGGLRNKDSIIEGIYLDDIEDSRKIKNDKEIGSFLGSYRILLSKKKDIYERKYISFLDFVSKFGSFISPIFIGFKLIATIFVSPNDRYRIYKSLRKKNLVESKEICDNYTGEEALIENDFENKVENDSCWNKFMFIFYCCCCDYCKKKSKHIKMVDEYIDDYLKIENKIKKENDKNNEIHNKQINSNDRLIKNNNQIELNIKNENENENYNNNYRHLLSASSGVSTLTASIFC